MKRTTTNLALTALALLTLSLRGWAQIAVSPVGSLRVEGDSTLHKWTSTATVIAMTISLSPGAPKSLSEAIVAGKVKGMEVKIPVAGLKSGESGLNKNL